jgi:DNA replication and repair protein RecF
LSNCVDTTAASDASSGSIDEIGSSYKKALSTGMKNEIEGRQVIVGPHRDDFGFYDSRHSVRHFGSTGEARLASILLKLAQVSFYTDVKKVKPVLLVDDILPELDPENKKSVLSLFGKENQVMVTAIEQSQLPEIFSCDRVFNIYENGAIQ